MVIHALDDPAAQGKQWQKQKLLDDFHGETSLLIELTVTSTILSQASGVNHMNLLSGGLSPGAIPNSCPWIKSISVFLFGLAQPTKEINNTAAIIIFERIFTLLVKITFSLVQVSQGLGLGVIAGVGPLNEQ